MLKLLRLPQAELSILLCTDPEIHALNKTFRHKNKPTDVLAFALREGEAGHLAGNALGDIVISVETTKRQAVEHGVSLKIESFTLLAHGLLHLLGWDHRTEKEDAAMRAETTRLVQCAIAGDIKRPPRRRTR
jgi:probable rRNA maturation factor